MYMGYNKIDINVLCYHCRNKNTGVQGMTVEQLYNMFYYSDHPFFADKKNNHQQINSIIVNTLLGQHDCTSCIEKIYAYG